MGTMQVKRTVVETVEFPDHFSYDDSMRGKLVDVLLGADGFRNDVRDNLFDEERVENSMQTLKEYYKTADLVMQFLLDNGVSFPANSREASNG